MPSNSRHQGYAAMLFMGSPQHLSQLSLKAFRDFYSCISWKPQRKFAKEAFFPK